MSLPRIRQYTPPDPEEQARLAQEIKRHQRAQARRRTRERPLRRRLLEAQGLPLRDLEAAVNCICSCHPRADTSLHRAGRSCPCQQTNTQRKASFRRLTKIIAELASTESGFSQMDHAVERRAQELDVTASIASPGAPFALIGKVGNRGFYLRERHDRYRVTVSPDDHPESDPWSAERESATVDIAEGTSADFEGEDGSFFAANALDIAVIAVRTYLRRQKCTHQTLRDARYCPDCGLLLQ